MTCKDCVHYEVCDELEAKNNIPKIFSCQCAFYRDKNVQMNNWISVKEKLPPKNTAVLCLIKYAEPDRWYTYALLTLYNGKWEQFWDNRLLHPEYQVTHWHTLPEPPKGDL